MSDKKMTMEMVLDIIKKNAAPDPADTCVNQRADDKTDSLFGNPSTIDLSSFSNQKEEMNSNWNTTMDFAVTSRRGPIGKLIVLFKRIIRKSIRWYIKPIIVQQQDFNASATHAMNELNNVLINTNAVLYEQNRRYNELVHTIEILEGDSKQQQDFNASTTRAMNELNNVLINTNIVLQEQNSRYNELVHTIEKLEGDSKQFVRVGLDQAVFDYVAFEKQFRGEEQELSSHQEMYIDTFYGCKNVVDLGCGHGDFLVSLKDQGISASGCDLCEAFVDECKEKDLSVYCEDAREFLSRFEDGTIDGVFLSQVVEHLNYDVLITLLRTCFQKMKQGSKIVIVTLNPQNLSTFTNAFFADPTHIRMVHPETLKFILSQNGFSSPDKILYNYSKINYEFPLLSAQFVDNLVEFNNGIQEINKLLFGYQDYTIIAKKG